MPRLARHCGGGGEASRVRPACTWSPGATARNHCRRQINIGARAKANKAVALADGELIADPGMAKHPPRQKTGDLHAGDFAVDAVNFNQMALVVG